MIFQLFLTFLAIQNVISYTWENVHIGGGGGFISGIVFNPTAQGVAYAKTDVGGVYRLNKDESWTPLMDGADMTTWHDWGIESVATDPVDPNRVYAAVGMYTNSWDNTTGSILGSSDRGNTWSTRASLPFKNGGNMPGRGMGERLAVDPKNNSVIYFGARSGNGLWKSVNQGVSFSKVESFTAVGTYVQDPSDTSGLNSDLQGVSWVTFDNGSEVVNGVSSRIFVGTAVKNDSSVYVTKDGGVTWTPIPGQPIGKLPHKAKYSVPENALYVTYSETSGPNTFNFTGAVWRWDSKSGNWSDITPPFKLTAGLTAGWTFGFCGLALDAKTPGTIMVGACSLFSPDGQIFRSLDSGATWIPIWNFNSTGGIDRYYTYDTDKAPWIKATGPLSTINRIGWWIESLEIDPFDSNHWLYGTGVTIYGGHDLTQWPKVHISSLADGIEETCVRHMISTPERALLAGVLDDAGFTFQKNSDLKTSPSVSWGNVGYGTPGIAETAGLDYAGNSPLKVVRTGGAAGDNLTVSTDGGLTWVQGPPTSASQFAGSLAYSADADAIVWVTKSGGSYRFTSGANGTVSNITTLPAVTVLASDKRNTSFFYAADSSKFYVSKDGGVSFSTSTVPGVPKSMVVHPEVAGDIWLSTATGLFHSLDFGSSFKQIPNVQSGYAIALGKGNGTYPNIYGFLNITNEMALRMSSDAGVSWTKIQDAGHGFGQIYTLDKGEPIGALAGSRQTEGLVFVGTNCRGVYYGMP